MSDPETVSYGSCTSTTVDQEIPVTAATNDKAHLHIGDQTIELPVIIGSEQERAVDIGQLRAKTGIVTIDNGFMNTASVQSAVTFLDGEQGILRYRGISIEELASKSNFLEVAHLLIQGRLPTQGEFAKYRNLITRHSLIHEDMKRFFDGYPSTAHPMAILSAMVCSLSGFYPEANEVRNRDQFDMTIIRLLAKLPTIAAFAYKKSIGQPFIYPRNDISYAGNVLNKMLSVPAES